MMSVTSLSKGIGIGKALWLKKINKVYSKMTIEEALLTYDEHKESVINDLTTLIEDKDSDVLLFQIAVLNDKILENDIKRRIKERKPVDKAFDEAIDFYIKELLKNDDPYFKSRVSDLKDLTSRLFQSYHETTKIKFNEPIILCVDELYPSMIFEFKNQLKGVIAKQGHALSHAAILLRERHIPFLVMPEFPFETGTTLLIDGYTNQVIKDPKQINKKKAQEEQADRLEGLKVSHKPYKLYLNLSGHEKIDKAYIDNSDGVGLYRSEFLYYTFNDFPSLEYQYEVYESLAKSFYPKPVVIRTYDFSEDKSLDGIVLHRGVAAYVFSYEQAFLEQMTALLMVNEKYDNLKIMIPMVYQKADYDIVYKIGQQIKEALKFEKPLPPIGVMIETKEAYNSLNDFSKVGFLSIGSNDLGSSLYGFDRTTNIDNERYIDSLSNAIYDIVSFAKDKRLPCTICGDIASQTQGFSRLLENGATDFSLSVPFLVKAKKIIKSK